MAIVDNVEQDRTQENPCAFCFEYQKSRQIIDNSDCKVIEPIELRAFAEIDMYYGLRNNAGHNVLQVRGGTHKIRYCPVCGLRLND